MAAGSFIAQASSATATAPTGPGIGSRAFPSPKHLAMRRLQANGRGVDRMGVRVAKLDRMANKTPSSPTNL
jgi:hypothetical protein